jgi:hypothetical protein
MTRGRQHPGNVGLVALAWAASLATGCGMRQPPITALPPALTSVEPPAPLTSGAFPQFIEGVLSAAITYRSYSAEELAVPGVRSIIEQCERSGGVECRQLGVPADTRQSFTRGIDQKVFAYFRLQGLSPGEAYDIRCLFLDPTESIVTVIRARYTIPPDRTNLNRHCSIPLKPTSPTGEWAVQLFINGEPASVLRFKVVEAPPASSTDYYRLGTFAQANADFFGQHRPPTDPELHIIAR